MTKNQVPANEKVQLTRYYEQMKQSILENENYVDALMDEAEAVYTVDLTHDRLEKIFFRLAAVDSGFRSRHPALITNIVHPEWSGSQRIPWRITALWILRKNFWSVSAMALSRLRWSIRKTDRIGEPEWLQKTVLMSQDTLYDEKKWDGEMTVVHGIILFKNTSVFHEKEQKEKERLKVAYEGGRPGKVKQKRSS